MSEGLIWEEAYRKYNNNLFRYLSHANRYMHQTLNDRLVDLGHRNFRTNFIDVIPYLDPDGLQLSKLVELHHLPKPALSRVINSVEYQGFLTKQKDPNNSRDSIIFITDKGVELIQIAYELSIEITKSIANKLGEERFTEFAELVHGCFKTLSLNYPPAKIYSPDKSNASIYGQLQIHLNTIVRHVDITLLENNLKSGFDDIQNNHRAILAHISDDGTRASQIAEVEGLTKQTVSDMSHALIENKYIRRIKDDSDKRAQRLVFTDRGKAMITNAMESLSAIENTIVNSIGDTAYSRLVDLSERLWFLLGGESPDSKPKNKDFSALEEELEAIAKALYQTVKSNHVDLLNEVFYEECEGVYLQGGFLNYLKSKRWEVG